MQNVEIKARYSDLAKGVDLCRALNAKYLGQDHQIDTYFKTPTGRLKMRESSLTGCNLIPYMRPDQTGPKKSAYALLPVKEPVATKELFKALLGLDKVVEKYREIYLVENVRVHLDEVVGLGKFLEFEAVYDETTEKAREIEMEKVRGLMDQFGVKDADLLTGSYRELKS